jgi:hypothetical protein
MSGQEVLDAAQRLARKGRPVFPCDPQSKRPRTRQGFKDATTDPLVIRAWFERQPDSMLGMPTGALSGLVVLDVDGAAGFESLRELECKHEVLPHTASVTTPRGGQHFFFRHPKMEVRCSVGTIGPAIDVRGDGGYVIVPPSRTADGRTYEVDEECAPAEMPPWLLAAAVIASDGPRQARPASEWVSIVRDGVRGPDPQNGLASEGRNDALARLCGHWLRHYVDPELVLELAQLVNLHRFRPPLPPAEVERTVDSIAVKELRRRQDRKAVAR